MAEFLYHLNLPHMSGRVVKFRELEPDEVEEAEDNGAREAGEDADSKVLRRAQLRWLVTMMIVGYTDPGQKPARLVIKPEVFEDRDEDGAVITPARAAETVIDGGRPDLEALKEATWKKVKDPSVLHRELSHVFNAKEQRVLRMLYTERHEINPMEMAMIMGKAIPAPSEG